VKSIKSRTTTMLGARFESHFNKMIKWILCCKQSCCSICLILKLK